MNPIDGSRFGTNQRSGNDDLSHWKNGQRMKGTSPRSEIFINVSSMSSSYRALIRSSNCLRLSCCRSLSPGLEPIRVHAFASPIILTRLWISGRLKVPRCPCSLVNKIASITHTYSTIHYPSSLSSSSLANVINPLLPLSQTNPK